MDPLIGKVIAGYRVLDVLGRGGMGIVYQAEDVRLGRAVALKMLDPALARDASFLRRFESEAQSLARLKHPNIVTIYAMPEAPEGQFIAMEFVEGGTLAERIRGRGALPWPEALPLFIQFLQAIEQAHEAGIIHRDVKPSNIMVTPAGAVKVTDFGLAKMDQGRDATKTQGVAGTLYYMSPEQVKGLSNVDHRSDLYSAGMTFYETLSGRTPFEQGASEFAIQKAIVEEKFPPPTRFNPDVPKGLARIVMKAIEKSPDRRFQHAREMREALERFQAEEDPRTRTLRPAAPRPSQPDAQNPRPDRKTRRFGPVVALLVALTAVGLWLLRPGEPLDGGQIPEPPPDSRVSVVSVVTQPEGASVFVNGDSAGLTPLRDYAVQAGPVDVRVQKTGFQDLDTALVVGAAEGKRLDLVLAAHTAPDEPVRPDPVRTDRPAPAPPPDQPPARQTGTLVLQAAEGGSAWVDGRLAAEDAGRPIPVSVSAGSHRIRFRHPTFGEQTFDVSVAAGGQTPVTCYFQTRVTVQSLLSGSEQFTSAAILVNDENRGDTPKVLDLGPGDYRITIRKFGFETVEGELSLQVRPALNARAETLIFHLKKKE